MKKSAIFTSIAMMMAFQEEAFRESREGKSNEIIVKKEPEKIIPKGCKEYHFRKSGCFDTTENTWDDIEYIFSCVASNDKNAIKKFEKFKEQTT